MVQLFFFREIKSVSCFTVCLPRRVFQYFLLLVGIKGFIRITDLCSHLPLFPSTRAGRFGLICAAFEILVSRFEPPGVSCSDSSVRNHIYNRSISYWKANTTILSAFRFFSYTPLLTHLSHSFLIQSYSSFLIMNIFGINNKSNHLFF